MPAFRVGIAGHDTTTQRSAEAPFKNGWSFSARTLTSLVEYERVPDELVGLPSGLLQAGASAVVGSLWEVPDPSTALLLGHFYRLHLGEGLSAATALHQAQRWLRESNSAELGLAEWYEKLAEQSGASSALRKAAYYRTIPDEKPFSHPYYWAAFTFTGTTDLIIISAVL